MVNNFADIRWWRQSMLFSYHVLLQHFLLFHLNLLLFLCSTNILLLFKKFYTERYYMITSSFQMSNKFINFESWVNIYGLPLLWCSKQIIVMLFCFEEVLLMCSKNVWNFPRRISFANFFSGILLQINFLFLSFLLVDLIVLLVIVLFMPEF